MKAHLRLAAHGFGGVLNTRGADKERAKQSLQQRGAFSWHCLKKYLRLYGFGFVFSLLLFVYTHRDSEAVMEDYDAVFSELDQASDQTRIRAADCRWFEAQRPL